MNDTVRLSRRELRLMFRRLLVAHDALQGSIPAIRDALVCATALGHPVLGTVLSQASLLESVSRISVPGYEIRDDVLVVDGCGQWAGTLAPTIADLVTLAVRRNAVTALEVTGVLDADLLDAARERLSSQRILLSRTGAATWTVARDVVDEQWLQAEQALITTGVPLDRKSWLLAYRKSLEGLAPESEESYKHAGYLNEAGELIQTMDDDEDIEAALTSQH